MHSQSQDGGDHPQLGTVASPLVVETIPKPEPQADLDRENAAEREKAFSDKKLVDLTGELALFTGLLFVATAILAAITFGLVWVGFKQVRDARKSINAAMKAAEAAEKTLQHGRETSERDLRAWLSAEIELAECHRSKDFAAITISVTAKNIGKTPAFRVGTSVNCYVKSGITTNYGALPSFEQQPHPLPALLPGAETGQRIQERISLPDIKAGVALARKDHAPPIIVVDVIVYYHTIFDAADAAKRMTSTRYFIFPNIDLAEVAARMAWLDEAGPAAIDQVRFAQDKSAPVYLT